MEDVVKEEDVLEIINAETSDLFYSESDNQGIQYNIYSIKTSAEPGDKLQIGLRAVCEGSVGKYVDWGRFIINEDETYSSTK